MGREEGWGGRQGGGVGRSVSGGALDLPQNICEPAEQRLGRRLGRRRQSLLARLSEPRLRALQLARARLRVKEQPAQREGLERARNLAEGVGTCEGLWGPRHGRGYTRACAAASTAHGPPWFCARPAVKAGASPSPEAAGAAAKLMPCPSHCCATAGDVSPNMTASSAAVAESAAPPPTAQPPLALSVARESASARRSSSSSSCLGDCCWRESASAASSSSCSVRRAVVISKHRGKRCDEREFYAMILVLLPPR